MKLLQSWASYLLPRVAGLLVLLLGLAFWLVVRLADAEAAAATTNAQLLRAVHLERPLLPRWKKPHRLRLVGARTPRQKHSATSCFGS